MEDLGPGGLIRNSRLRVRLLIVILSAAVAILNMGCAAHDVPKTHLVASAQHARIISIDGLSPDALLQANTPNMDFLMQKGAFSLLAQSIVPSTTLPSHASMISGVTIEKHRIR